VNLIGVLYSTSRLALHYLNLNRINDSLRALVLLGSMGISCTFLHTNGTNQGNFSIVG